MPVIVETLAQPSAQDRLDLAKIYADAPDWLFAPHADGAALVAAGLAAGELFAGRFNDRLLGAALLRRGGDAWQLSHLCVRGITRGRGVGRRLLDEARRLAAEAGKPLRLVAPDGHLESRASPRATGCRWTASDMLGGGPRHGASPCPFPPPNAPPCLPSRESARPCCNAWNRWAWTVSSGCATAMPQVSSPKARP